MQDNCLLSLSKGDVDVEKDIVAEINALFSSYSKLISDFTLCVVCNTKNVNTQSDIMSTEYFSESEFEEIVSLFSTLDMNMEFFLNEDDFIRFIISRDSLDHFVVYNAAQSGRGAGRKSLIPAFCNLHKIPCTGSNAYVVSLCRHKYHVNKLLLAGSFPVPSTWLYINNIQDKDIPNENEKIILKPIYESASIGIDNDSVINYNENEETLAIIRKKQQNLKQPIMLQQFINGFEVEVPVISYNGIVIGFPPVGISLDDTRLMGDQILNYELVYFDRYQFFDFTTISELSEQLIQNAKKAALYLGIEGLGRIDFRINSKEEKFYITDVSTNPHFVTHSAVHFTFQQSGLCDSDIVKAIICCALSKL
jgi:D-alanine-D-alanine ligase